MTDYKTKPYAQWMEDVLPELVELDPESIGIICVMPDGTTGTSYYNADNEVRAGMIRAMLQDNLMGWIEANAEVIKDVLFGEEEEE